MDKYSEFEGFRLKVNRNVDIDVFVFLPYIWPMKKYPNFDQKISVSKNNEKKTAVIHTFFSLLVKFFCNMW